MNDALIESDAAFLAARKIYVAAGGHGVKPVAALWPAALSGLSGLKAEHLKYWLPLCVILLMHRSCLSTGSPYLLKSDISQFFSGPLGCLPENLGKSSHFLR